MAAKVSHKDTQLVYKDPLGLFDAEVVTNKFVTHIELRRNFPGMATGFATHVLIVVSLDGYNFKKQTRDKDRWNRSTKGIQVRWSANGPVNMKLSEFQEAHEAVNAAYCWLYERYAAGDISL